MPDFSPMHRLLCIIGTCFLLTLSAAQAEENQTIATVNGKPITQLDLDLAEAEIGSDLGNLPTATKRRVLVEYLIETVLFADAAKSKNLDSGTDFKQRMEYLQRRALRESYFENVIKSEISESTAKSFYDDSVKGLKPQEEIKARHILVDTEADADDLLERIGRGAEFAELAKKHSKDPGTKHNGGLLGFFTRGQMVPAFEEAAFNLPQGEISEPVKSRFGWHLIKVEEKRTKPIPAFEEVKDKILNSLAHQKTQSITKELRDGAKIEYLDPEIKAVVERQKERQETRKKILDQLDASKNQNAPN